MMTAVWSNESSPGVNRSLLRETGPMKSLSRFNRWKSASPSISLIVNSTRGVSWTMTLIPTPWFAYFLATWAWSRVRHQRSCQAHLQERSQGGLSTQITPNRRFPLVSGVCFAGSGRTIPKEHFFGFESILGKTQDFGQLAAYHNFVVLRC